VRATVNVLNLSLVLLLVFIALYANASEQIATAASEQNICTTWSVKDPTSICLLTGGEEGLYYTRQCENEERVCRWRHTSDCEKVELCTQDDPNTLIDCGPWRRVNGMECINRNTGHSEQKWARSCVIGGMDEEHCSNRPPVGAH
jgi:hypothetical protein